MEDPPGSIFLPKVHETENPETTKPKSKKSKKKKSQSRTKVTPEENESKEVAGNEPKQAAGGEHPHKGNQLVEYSIFHDKEVEKKEKDQEEEFQTNSIFTDKNLPIEVVRSPESTRLYAVVLTVGVSLILGCIAVGLECHVYFLDKHWNEVVTGKKFLKDTQQFGFFDGKTFELGKHHKYLQKAVDYAIRDEGQELVFMIFISLFMLAEALHMCAYMKIIQVEISSMQLTLFYGMGGALCMLSSTFLVSAAHNIEENYSYVLDMFYNFNHMNDGAPYFDPLDDKCRIKGEFHNGCSSYEKSKAWLEEVMKVFRACEEGSRYTRYNKGRQASQEVQLGMHTYLREELKTMGFCSRDGFKFAAAFCAVLMGLVCSIVPILYCCCGKRAVDKEPSVELGTMSTFMNYDPAKVVAPSSELPGEPGEQEAIKRFREYVEKESDEDEKYARMYPRELFNFKVRGSKGAHRD